MLEIKVPACEQWDESNQCFVIMEEQTLKLEHSLVSLSKWESKWCKPFLTKTPMTHEQTIDYVRFMTINKNVDPNVYNCLTNDNIESIKEYIEAPMTATWFRDNKGRHGSGEQTTAELIYYWMISLNIPFECEKWHLNRLLTLIRVCNIKNQPPKKMGKKETASQYAAINAARRKAHNMRG